jgi:hypothetical protein
VAVIITTVDRTLLDVITITVVAVQELALADMQIVFIIVQMHLEQVMVVLAVLAVQVVSHIQCVAAVA